jgi:hypothetical protein
MEDFVALGGGKVSLCENTGIDIEAITRQAIIFLRYKFMVIEF